MSAVFLVSAASAETWRLETWSRPFDYESASRTIDYRPLETASRKWRLCVAYPHLKDSYWLSVNYGMVAAVRRLGVAMRLYEAGGYPNLDRQIQQVRECVDRGADALIVGTVSYDGLTPTIREIGRRMPVVAAVNDIADPGIAAKAAVSWEEMGRKAGAYLAARYPAGGVPAKVAWFPGPKTGGWVPFVERGFREGIADGAIEVVATKWGDTGKEIQLVLLEEVLEDHPDIDAIVGSAVTADAAVSLLRARGRLGEIEIVADYFTHGVYRGIKRGRILAAPTDAPALQGRLAIDMAVRLLEGKLEIRHAGPPVVTVDAGNVDTLDIGASLAPAHFMPAFVVE